MTLSDRFLSTAHAPMSARRRASLKESLKLGRSLDCYFDAPAVEMSK